jgi:gliding motility-associated-like protein
MNFFKIFISFLGLFFLTNPSCSQVILNGSFEETSSPMACNYNLANPAFNALMTDVEAYGAGNETDILIDGCFTSGIPDGDRAIGLAHVPRDEVSLALDAPLTTGVSYTLSFWSFSSDYRERGDVEIGCSTSSTTFGILVHTAVTVVETWINHEFTFVAPNDATHITVRNAAGALHWNHVDHFEFISDDPVVTTIPPSCPELCDASATVVPGDSPPYTYLWDAAADFATTATVTDLCAGTYEVEVTDGAGVVTMLSLEITDPPSIEIGYAETVPVSCFGEADGGMHVVATGGEGDLTYDIGLGPFLSGEFLDLTGGSYDMIITDENECTIDTTLIIEEPVELVLTATPEHIACHGESTGLVELASIGGTGLVEYSTDAITYGPTALFEDLSAGTYTYYARDENGCEADIEIEIFEPSPIEVEETVVGEVCFGDCQGEISLLASGGTGAFLYSIDDCATSDVTGEFTGLCSGDYDVCIVDENGCAYTDVLVVAEGDPSDYDASIIDPGVICINDGPITIAVEMPGGELSGPGIVGFTFDPIAAGVGLHELTYIIDEGCGDEQTIEIEVAAIPSIDFTAVPTEGCVPLTVLFEPSGDPGSSCYWDFGDGSTSSSCTSMTYTYELAGLFDVTYTITDANGCSNTIVKGDLIDAHVQPIADFNYSPNPIYTNDPTVDFENTSTGETAWDWTFEGAGSSMAENPSTIFPEIAGDYDVVLTVTNEDGCTDEITKTISIREEQLIYVPNAFTPDGDNFNDTFIPVISGIDVYDYTLTIYNRWGEILFISYNSAVGWDGTYNGSVVSDGIYVWHIAASEIDSDKKFDFKGHITVLK